MARFSQKDPNGPWKDEIMKSNSAIKKAYDQLEDMGHDPKMQALYELREKSLHDFNTSIGSARRGGLEEGVEKGVEKGKAEGIAEGIEKGKVEGRIETLYEMVRKMKASGQENALIAKITGLPLEEIAKI